MKSRLEHLQWCKSRAIAEYDFYSKEGIVIAVRNGLTSMMSDINKHTDTNSKSLSMLCMAKMMTIRSRQDFVNFIKGFN
jgi:hypothetical protein